MLDYAVLPVTVIKDIYIFVPSSMLGYAVLLVTEVKDIHIYIKLHVGLRCATSNRSKRYTYLY